MNSSNATQSFAKTTRLIHAALFTGTVLVAIVFLVVRSRPDTPPPTQPPVVAMALAALAAVALAVAAALLRPRIAARGTAQSADAYWGDARNRTNALILWAVVEGAGLLGAMACFATGLTWPLSIVAIAVIVGILFRPGTLEGSAT